MYGGLETITSICAVDRRVPVADAKIDVEPVLGLHCAARLRCASAEISVAVTAQSPRSRLMASAMAPEPVPRSSTRACGDEPLQRELDQQFGFGSRNQYRRRYVEREIPEFALSGDVGERRSAAVLLEASRSTRRASSCVERLVAVRVQIRAVLRRARAQSTLRSRAARRPSRAVRNNSAIVRGHATPSAASASA